MKLNAGYAIRPDSIEVFPTADGQYSWHFVAANGKIRADSETFPTRSHAVRAAKGMVTTVGLMLGVAPAFTSRRQGSKTVLTVEAGLAL